MDRPRHHFQSPKSHMWTKRSSVSSVRTPLNAKVPLSPPPISLSKNYNEWLEKSPLHLDGFPPDHANDEVLSPIDSPLRNSNPWSLKRKFGWAASLPDDGLLLPPPALGLISLDTKFSGQCLCFLVFFFGFVFIQGKLCSFLCSH